MGSQTWEPEHQFPQFKMWIVVLSEGSWYSNYITDLKRLINHKALYHYKGIYYKRWKSPCLYTEHAWCPPITRFPLMIPVQSYFYYSFHILPLIQTSSLSSRMLIWLPNRPCPWHISKTPQTHKSNLSSFKPLPALLNSGNGVTFHPMTQVRNWVITNISFYSCFVSDPSPSPISSVVLNICWVCFCISIFSHYNSHHPGSA